MAKAKIKTITTKKKNMFSFILSIIYAFNNVWKSGFETGWAVNICI